MVEVFAGRGEWGVIRSWDRGMCVWPVRILNMATRRRRRRFSARYVAVVSPRVSFSGWGKGTVVVDGGVG